ncbi:MAG: hypothetical protein QF645_07095, partial [Planctomycetota bacterium]|nr:hypothetical protein [Planctomycetota bacterium]
NNGKILDVTGGIGVLSLGHNHPRILNARIEFQKKKKMEAHKKAHQEGKCKCKKGEARKKKIEAHKKAHQEGKCKCKKGLKKKGDPKKKKPSKG